MGDHLVSDLHQMELNRINNGKKLILFVLVEVIFKTESIFWGGMCNEAEGARY